MNTWMTVLHWVIMMAYYRANFSRGENIVPGIRTEIYILWNYFQLQTPEKHNLDFNQMNHFFSAVIRQFFAEIFVYLSVSSETKYLISIQKISHFQVISNPLSVSPNQPKSSNKFNLKFNLNPTQTAFGLVSNWKTSEKRTFACLRNHFNFRINMIIGVNEKRTSKMYRAQSFEVEGSTLAQEIIALNYFAARNHSLEATDFEWEHCKAKLFWFYHFQPN